MRESRALQELQSAADGGDLAVRITLFYPTRNYPTYVPYNATLGYVVGVIGTPSAGDTLNVPGERVMTHTGNVPDVVYTDPNDLCYQQNNLSKYHHWMNDAPFEVDEGRNEVRFDLSNSVPSDLNNMLRNIGTLRLGILMTSSLCVLLLGDESGIPYDSTEQLHITSGIHTIAIDPLLVAKVTGNPLVIVQILDGDRATETNICGLSTERSHAARILLQEQTYYIRPKGYYAGRVERVYNPSSTQTLYVTKYGVPAENVGVVLRHLVDAELKPPGLPTNGVTPASFTATSDANGFVEFVFNIDAHIPEQREYVELQNCTGGTQWKTFPIGGQVYYFTYRVDSSCGAGVNCSDSGFTITYLAFSDFHQKDSYDWIHDVGPILSQYARLSPIMAAILNMSSYVDVTKPRNINLLTLALSLDLEDPSYMPTTRDLSTAKKTMILEWLKNPLKSDLPGSTLHAETTPSCKLPTSRLLTAEFDSFTPRCKAASISFLQPPRVLEPYYQVLLDDPSAVILKGGLPNRPLFATGSRGLVCGKTNLAIQLQTAIALEWATIPAYLTSLYSIIDGCNREVYGIIRSVIMQEMLHFTQVANILIAIGGSPLIDDPSVAPNYPTYLPGHVFPKLVVNLEKLSLEHVHRVFMGIELPQDSEVAGDIHNDLTTIGYFYKEISDCIEELGDGIFNASTLNEQVKWPWHPTKKLGDVVTVINAMSAKAGIKMITSQGEGANLVDPSDISNNSLAHFFKFEEIVCQRKLKAVSEDTYAYVGAPIPFRPDGVWPMRYNPAAFTVPADTNCYTESRAFHQVYRTLLRKLQEVFNGQPQKIGETITIMESLQVHAKKLMWTKFRPDSTVDDTTCGPVWDYHWPEPKKC